MKDRDDSKESLSDSLAICFSPGKAFFKKVSKDWAGKDLAPKSNLVSDGLECLTAFKENDNEHFVIIAGSGSTELISQNYNW